MEELTLFTAKTADEVIYCLERGDNINLKVRGETPFIYHCKNNNVEVVLSLIEHNCYITIHDPYMRNGLESVCLLGHSNLLREMLQYANVRALLNPVGLPPSIPPLFEACINGHTDIFDILVQYGADIDLPINGKITPLMMACMTSREDIVIRLLQLGAKVNQRNTLGQTAIFKCKKINILHLLYNYGADINIQNNRGNTPLLELVSRDGVEEALINLGPDLNIRNNNGKTALIKAVKYGSSKIVEKLLEAGADVNISDNKGNTAFDYITNNLRDHEEKRIILNKYIFVK